MSTPAICWVIGLIFWLAPWPAWVPSTVHKVGEYIFVIAFAVWLGLFH